MKPIFLFLVSIVFTFSKVKAQNNDTLIKQIINLFFEGMESNDTAKIRSTLDTTCFLKTIVKPQKGETVLYDEKVEEFFSQVVKARDLVADEQLLSFDIKIDGAMAMVWTPYNFYFNKKFSHCGVNVFTMIKRGEQWKILGITDTRRRQGCGPQ